MCWCFFTSDRIGGVFGVQASQQLCYVIDLGFSIAGDVGVELTSGSYLEVVLEALLRWVRCLISLTSGDRLLVRNHLEVPDQRTKPSGQPFTRLLIPPRDSYDSLLPIDAKVQWESCPDTVCESNSLTQLHNLRLHQANLLTEDREPKIDTLVL